MHTHSYDYESAYKIISDIYASTILRDTIQRYNIRDIELLERVIKFILEKYWTDIFSAQYSQVF